MTAIRQVIASPEIPAGIGPCPSRGGLLISIGCTALIES